MRTPFLLAVALAAALLLAGCGSGSSSHPSPADVHITCADVVNQGLASACTSGITQIPAAAPLGTTTDGGTVSRATLIEVDATITNSGGTDSSYQTIFAFNVICGAVFAGRSYSVMGSTEGPIAAGASVPSNMGSNCSDAPPGPAQAVIYLYPGNSFIAPPRGWTPDDPTYAAIEEDHWIVNVTFQ